MLFFCELYVIRDELALLGTTAHHPRSWASTSYNYNRSSASTSYTSVTITTSYQPHGACSGEHLPLPIGYRRQRPRPGPKRSPPHSARASQHLHHRARVDAVTPHRVRDARQWPPLRQEEAVERGRRDLRRRGRAPLPMRARPQRDGSLACRTRATHLDVSKVFDATERQKIHRCPDREEEIARIARGASPVRRAHDVVDAATSSATPRASLHPRRPRTFRTIAMSLRLHHLPNPSRSDPASSHHHRSPA